MTTKGTSNKEVNPLSEQFFAQVSESIQMMFDLTSRVDERVKMLIERQKQCDDHIDKLIEIQQETIHRLGLLEKSDPEFKKEVEKLHTISSEIKNTIHVFELKMETMSLKIGNHDTRWTQIFDAVWKIILMIIAGYILYKLGLQAPPS